MTKNPRYKIVLEIVPRAGAGPPINRLKAFLKAAWRQWGIRNQGIVPAADDDDLDPYAGQLPEVKP